MQEEGEVKLWGGRNYLAWICLRNIPFLWLPPKVQEPLGWVQGLAGRKEKGFIPWRKKRELICNPIFGASPGSRYQSRSLPQAQAGPSSAWRGFLQLPQAQSCQGLLLPPWGCNHTGPAGAEMEHSLSCCAPQGARSFGSKGCTKLFTILLSELFLTSCTHRNTIPVLHAVRMRRGPFRGSQEGINCVILEALCDWDIPVWLLEPKPNTNCICQHLVHDPEVPLKSSH